VGPGAVRLRVADLEGQREFYERAIGLRPIEPADGPARRGYPRPAVVELDGSPDAPPRPARTTGLFHLAILVPDRPELAAALARVVRAGWRLSGASDHLVSEALYLDDPEGNGIEIYRDRPRAEWGRDGGELLMSTLPLDVDGLLAELHENEPEVDEMRAGTRIGHVHLNVADLEAAENFYSRALGLDVTVRGYPGALFLSSGGYHHHIGVNTWAGLGAPAPPAGSRGLEWFELAVDGEARLGELERRLADAGADLERRAEGVLTRDPSGNGVLLTSAAAPPD
jgi:catechol 2,3-dioxygenase